MERHPENFDNQSNLERDLEISAEMMQATGEKIKQDMESDDPVRAKVAKRVWELVNSSW